MGKDGKKYNVQMQIFPLQLFPFMIHNNYIWSAPEFIYHFGLAIIHIPYAILWYATVKIKLFCSQISLLPNLSATN